MRRAPTNRLTLALIGIAVISAIVYFSFSKRIPFVHGYRMSANFASSNQLVSGFSPVRIAGVTVGKVTSIKAGPDGTSQVQMELKDDALPIHRDAMVRIRPRLFLEGGFYVELDSGSPSAPKLPDGGVLPRAQTAGPVQLHQILTALQQDTLGEMKSIVKELDVALGNGGAESLGRAIVDFGPVLRDTAQIAEAARGSNVHDVSQGIGATSKIVGTLAARQNELRGLVTSLNTTTSALAARNSELAGTVSQIDGLVREAPATLDSLDRVQPTIREFIAALRPSLRAAPPILRDASRTFVQLRGLTSPNELPALVPALSPTIRALPSLNRRLQDLFARVTPVMNCLRTRAVPVLNAKVPDGNLSTGLAVWQELTQAGTAVVSFAQNFDGNGYNSRYLNGEGDQSISTGQVPGLPTLVGTVDQPLEGARPTYLGPTVNGKEVLPPFHPEAPCTSQAVADLSQRASGSPLSTRTAPAQAVGAEQRAAAVKLFDRLRTRAQGATR